VQTISGVIALNGHGLPLIKAHWAWAVFSALFNLLNNLLYFRCRQLAHRLRDLAVRLFSNKCSAQFCSLNPLRFYFFFKYLRLPSLCGLAPQLNGPASNCASVLKGSVMVLLPSRQTSLIQVGLLDVIKLMSCSCRGWFDQRVEFFLEIIAYFFLFWLNTRKSTSTQKLIFCGWYCHEKLNLPKPCANKLSRFKFL